MTLEYVDLSQLQGLHVFLHKEQSLVFHPESFSLFRVGAGLASIIRDLKAGSHLSQIAQDYNVDLETLVSRLATMGERINRERREPAPYNSDDPALRQVSLTLHVSNACNLDCDYCYAEGGDYGRTTQTRMDKTLALQTVDKMYANFPHIASIMFFGGEPLLAVDVINTICDHINAKFDRGEIKGIPEYTMVSNGTLVTDEAINLLKKHTISVTVSVDGPKALTDKLRPYKGGKGSYDAVHDGFYRIVNEVGRVPQVEATYTKAHQDAGMTMEGLVGFLQKEFLFSVGTVATVEVPDGHPLALAHDQSKDDVADMFTSLVMSMAQGEMPKMEQSLLTTMLQFVKKGRSRFICSVGHDSFNITTDGEVFPCQVFIQRPEFSLGRIEDFNINNPSSSSQKAFDRLTFRDKERNPICSGCWVKEFCTSCPGSHTFSANNDEVPGHFCTDMRGWIEKVLGLLYELKSDETMWSRFLKGLISLGEELESQGRTRAIHTSPLFADHGCGSCGPTLPARPKLYQIEGMQVSH